MSDKQPTQAMASGHDGGKDGVGNAPGKTAGGSESGGGAYPNPHSGKDGGGAGGGFMGHGGQSGMEYSGTGDGKSDDDVGNENAVTK